MKKSLRKNNKPLPHYPHPGHLQEGITIYTLYMKTLKEIVVDYISTPVTVAEGGRRINAYALAELLIKMGAKIEHIVEL